MFATHVYYFFWFFQSPTASLHGFQRLIRQTTQFCARMILLIVKKSEFSYLTEFFGKIEKNYHCFNGEILKLP